LTRIKYLQLWVEICGEGRTSMLEYPTTNLMLECLFADYGILSGSSNMLFIGDLALWMGLAETFTVERQPG
jgi:hypothetical protein